MAARISEIRIRKVIFYNESKSNKKKFWRLGGEGVGVWLG